MKNEKVVEKNIFSHLLENIRTIFSGYRLIGHFTAIMLTYIFVTSGFDWNYLTTAPAYLSRTYFFPALFLGTLFPVLVPLVLYIWGKITEDREVKATAFAVGQAALLGSLISSFYKAITGRIPPHVLRTAENALPTVDISHGFQFGFFRGGIFWGWPSSHTTIAFAMAVAFTYLFARKGKWAYLALLYALYVGVAVSFTIHWFSEFIAGAIIGSIIGMVVARSFSIEKKKSFQM